MDIQTQIAARRAELERKAREEQSAAAEEAKVQAKARREAERARYDAEQVRRAAALDAIAVDLSRSGTVVQRKGGDLEIAGALPPLDVEGLRRSQLNRLLLREARKLWTPGQNWQVITLIVAGLFLITFYGLGLLLIIAGMLRRSALNKRYQAEVRERYPGVFPLPQAPTKK